MSRYLTRIFVCVELALYKEVRYNKQRKTKEAYMIEEIKQKILSAVASRDYQKGMNYEESYIDYINCTYFDNSKRFQFLVESESSYQKYMVQIEMVGQDIKKTLCTCLQFQQYHSCKHVAACLIIYSNKMFSLPKETITKKSVAFLEKLKKQFTQEHLKKEEVFLEPYLSFESSYYHDYLVLKVKIGQEKKYSLLGKLSSFLNEIRLNHPYSFGANFTFEPQRHYFSKESLELLNLLDMMRKYYRVSGNSIYLDDTLFKQIIKLFPNKIHMENPERIVPLKKEFPLTTELSKTDDKYRVILKETELIKPLTEDYEYVYFKNCIYHLTKDQSFFLKESLHTNLEELLIPESEFTNLQKNVIRLVKDHISLDDSVSNLVIVNNPDVKFYIDINEEDILCTPKFIYQEEEISYFDKSSTILRDIDYENEVVRILDKYAFQIGKDCLYLEDLTDICAFLEEGLDELASEYPVFTSEKVKNTKILKKSNISSTFSIGKDNILHYEFDLGNIPNEELDKVMASLKQKKKYYRLKNGDILSLEDQALQELNALTEELELSKNDLNNAQGEIHKYRALYLDSIKNSKYKIIKTDSLFKEFIDQFKEFQNVEVNFTKEEQKILRDYQILGIKWLYMIHKCGFGGILADEMGLGKSLQTIYFMHKILKEDKTAKLLIVCPTSLVYNWESEFLKFAPEMSYHVFAEQKEKRHEELENYQGNVYITSYGLLREDLELYQEKSFKIFVIDEAQNIKNPTTGLTKAVKSIKADTKLALTGTPIENSIVELWSIFDFIMPGFLSNLMKFQKKYKVKDFDEETNQLLENLRMQIKPFILRRKKNEVIKDLPPKIENNIYIDLNEEQKKIYAAEVKYANDEMTKLVQSGGFTKNKMMILSLLTKLRQICISPEITLKDYQGGSSKMENLLKIIKEQVLNGHKILLFTSFKTALELVKKALDEENISNYTIAGDVSAQKRKMLVDAFNKDNTNVFLIMLKSGGTGLNLTSADVVIHLDLWWNPQAENQATDRTHRIGQTKTVEVIKLICKGTIEEKILDLQQKKKMLSDKMIEEGMNDSDYLKSLTEKDIRDLLAYENKE